MCDWCDTSQPERDRLKAKVYEYFPGDTLDNDGTFTSGINTVAKLLELMEGELKYHPTKIEVIKRKMQT